MMKKSIFAVAFAAALGLALLSNAQPAPLPEATAAHLPRWRGFNLTEKFFVSGNKPFAEEDFQIISELGFNFARLPMDYRIWIKNGDWKQIDESAFPEIDQAIAYGEKYGVHICINFHRAPGYTVAKPPEARDLWTDPEAQEVCAAHWAYFARRYKGIPSRRLSFDLMNEPGKVAPETYRAVVQKLAEAIHREDPDRLIIADGLAWGTKPCPELAGLGVAEATRGYTPMALTHYLANWVHSTPQMAPPLWPMPKISSVLKPAHSPSDPAKELTVEGPFAAPTSAWVAVSEIQPHCQVVVEADGQPLAAKTWENKREEPDYLCFEIPAGTRGLKLSARGSWALASTLAFRPKTGVGADREFRLDPWQRWDDVRSVPVRFDPADASHPFKAAEYFDKSWLQTEMIAPWKELEARGVGVVVGEFGVYNKTPHAVALAFMEDSLRNWREAGWGWALWNLSGSFGILDSQRADVVYEDYRGHKLDRAMLRLLQKY